MRWLLLSGLLPLLVCGGMCLVPAALVLLGIRRRDQAPSGPACAHGKGSSQDAEHTHSHEAVR